MKNLISSLMMVLFLVIAVNAIAQKKTDPVVYLKSNMHCGECEKTLFEHLRFETGVKDLKLDHVSNTIKIVYTDKKATEESLCASVVKKGYTADKISEEEYTGLVEKAKKDSHQPASKH